VDLKDLISENLEVETGLQIGQILEIPKGTMPTKEKPLNPIEGYTFRKVLPGETIYGLSVEYKISQEDLLIANPQIQGQVLRVGELVQVPMTPDELESLEENVEVAQVQWQEEREEQREQLEEREEKEEEAQGGTDTIAVDMLPKNPKLQVYQIQEGDSLDLIAQKFNVSSYWIEKYNPDVIDGLTAGNYIVIPMKQTRQITLVNRDSDSIKTYTTTVPLKIALVLPFDLGRLDSLRQSRIPLSERDQMAFEFFAGFKVAIDSLSHQGRSLRIALYDSRKDIEYVKDVLADKIAGAGTDLVIGPLYSTNAEVLASALAKDSIPVVSPLSKKIDLQGKSNLYNCIPSKESEIDQIALFLNKTQGDEQLILVHIKNEENVRKVEKLKSLLIPQVHPIKEVWLSEELPNSGYFNRFPTKGTENVFVTLDNSQALLATLIGQLHNLPNDTVKLVAGSTLRSMETVDYGYLNGLSFVCAEPYWVDYRLKANQRVIEKYRIETNSEPTKFSFSGFDVAWYFVKTFSDAPLNLVPHKGVAFDFSFPEEGSHQNTGMHLLQLKDYEFYKR